MERNICQKCQLHVHAYIYIQQVPSYLDYGTNVCVQFIVTSWAYQYKYCSLNAYVNIIPALLNGSSFQLFQCNGNGTIMHFSTNMLPSYLLDQKLGSAQAC